MRVEDKSIRMHRALRVVSAHRVRVARVLFLPAAFTLILWLGFSTVTDWWKLFFDFWLPRLNLPCESCSLAHERHWLGLEWPHLHLASSALLREQRSVVAIIFIFTLLVSVALPERFLPLKYFLRLAAFVQAAALIVSVVDPQHFYSGVNRHLETVMLFSVLLLLIVPWLYALTFYVLDMSIRQILALTLMTWGYLLAFTPVFVLVHAFLLTRVSVLLMPVLYFLFGVIVPLMACIAFYGWGMSWSRASVPPEYDRRNGE